MEEMLVSPVVNVSLNWYKANVLASVDGSDQHCSQCGARICVFLDVSQWICDNCTSINRSHQIVSGLDALFDRKYMQISDLRRRSFSGGIRKPICIVVSPAGFVQGNGNHRVAFAMRHGFKSIPAVFSFDGDYMHSNLTSGWKF